MSGGFSTWSTRPERIARSGTPARRPQALPSLPPGGRASIDMPALPASYSCTGRQTLAYSLNISYSAGGIGGLKQRGAKPLYVQCMD